MSNLTPIYKTHIAQLFHKVRRLLIANGMEPTNACGCGVGVKCHYYPVGCLNGLILMVEDGDVERAVKLTKPFM